jgi:fibronectin-binding autotransporter adhesin
MIKHRRPMFVTAAVAALLLVTASAATAVPALAAGAKGPSCGDSWKNRTGGTWSTGSDWSTGAPPTASQNACITIALTAPVELTGAGTAKSLTLGGQSGTAELEDDNQVLSLGSSSAITRVGEFVAEGGGSNAIALRSGATLSNDGTVEVESGSVLQLSGHVTNAPDGWTGITGTLAIDIGTFTNSGEVSVQPGGYLEAPYKGATGAVIDNAAGAIQNQGHLYLGRGATFDQGAGKVIGAAAQIGAPSSGGSLHLTGRGAGRFVLGASAMMSGNIAAGQTVTLDGTGSTAPAATGSFTNDGTLTGGSGGLAFTLPAGDTLTNAGSIVVPSPGDLLTLAGNVVNDGTIAMNGSTLKLAGAVTLTNHGTITVPPQSTLDTGSAGTINNAGGTIASGGLVNVEDGGTFVEGAGATTGNYVSVNGALKLAGSGASSFGLWPGSTISGTIAARQTVLVFGTSGRPVTSARSFTNHGTVVGSGWLALPAGGTLTNDGTIEDGGPANSTLYVAGNLINASPGVIGEENGTLIMARVGTTFDNAGRLYLLFSQSTLLNGADNCGGSGEPACDITFDNTGTIYWGTQGGDWGGSDPGSMIGGAKGDEVDLGGTIVPVPDGEPNSWPPPAGDSIGWGLTNANYISTTQEWALSCDASVTEGWSMTCPHSGAMLYENGGTTEVPTRLSLTGSGTSRGTSGWTSAYGRPVSLTATVTAQDGSTPTGTVAFYAAEANIGSSSSSDDATAADLAGTAALSTADGVTTATLTYNPPPEQYRLLAIYSGDSAHLPSDAGAAGFTSYYATQVVDVQTTGVTVKSSAGSSAFGSPVTFTAALGAGATGPAKPTGVVTFYDAGVPFGTVPVSTTKGVTTARITFDGLPAGSDAITATYSGDYDYAAATTSSSLSESVTAPSPPSKVTAKGPSRVRAGGTYKATSTTRGTGAVLFSLAGTPAPPKGMTINPSTGAVSYKIPKKGTSRFSFAVVASNAAGQAASARVQVKVS